MSSHHFVKEGQEPALLIVEAISFQRIEPLLEWVPLVLVTDDVLEEILHWGIKIDVVLQSRYARAALEIVVKDQIPVQIPATKNDDPLSNGLQFLIERGVTFVNLIVTPREEIFQSLEQFALHLQIGIYDENEKWSLVRAGKLEKWLPAGYEILLKPSAGSLLRTEGLLQKGGIWQTFEPGIVVVESASPFWIAEPL